MEIGKSGELNNIVVSRRLSRGGTEIEVPGPETIILKGDILTLVGHPPSLRNFRPILASRPAGTSRWTQAPLTYAAFCFQQSGRWQKHPAT
ncbi:MAG: hypothetical protein IPM82_05660 [Saprospiraceae bacterium]|nr:hypothetical protein [Saprospiraceae bacterium]